MRVHRWLCTRMRPMPLVGRSMASPLGDGVGVPCRRGETEMRETARRFAVVCVLCLMGLAAPVAWGEGAKASRERGPLIINEISPAASHAASPWIELFNSSDGALSLAGTVLESAPKVAWELPPGLPPVPRGAFVLVHLDGGGTAAGVPKAGPDLIVLHAPAALAKPWAAVRGELAVYRPGPSNADGLQLVNYVAWGAPGSVRGQKKGDKGCWPASWFVPLAEGFGVYDPTTRLAPGASIGLYPGNPGATPEDWAIYDKDEATPGKPNAVPRPKAFTLADGAVVGANSVAVGWATRKGDERYRFQLAADKEFKKPLVDAIVVGPALRIGQALPAGTYFYRVTALAAAGESLLCCVRVVVVINTACDIPGGAALRGWVLNPTCPTQDCKIIPTIQFKFQRKDTRLACLECRSEAAPTCPWDCPHRFCIQTVPLTGSADQESWLCADESVSRTCAPVLPPCQPTPTPTLTRCPHGDNYCALASISMMASAYGACLSQDRIAFMLHSESDLRHDQTLFCNADSADSTCPGQHCTVGLKWALGTQDIEYHSQSPDFEQLRGWVEAGRPVMTKLEDENHLRVLAGYCVGPAYLPAFGPSTAKMVFIYDPWSGPRAESFEKWSSRSGGTWVGPPVNSRCADRVRSDEYSVWQDSDHDRIADFDEIWRFSTDPLQPSGAPTPGHVTPQCPAPTPTPRPGL